MMIFPIMLFLLGVAPAFAADDAEPMPSCNVETQFKDAKFQPILDRLRGTVSMQGKFVCSAALVTFKGRDSSAPGLVLTAGHCSDRGSVQIPLRDKTISAPDAGEVLYRLSDRRSLSLETGNSAGPRTCIETDRIEYGTLTDADITWKPTTIIRGACARIPGPLMHRDKTNGRMVFD